MIHLIGSAATYHWMLTHYLLESDVDIICTEQDLLEFRKSSYHLIEFLLPSKFEGKYKCKLKDGTRLEFDCMDNESNRLIMARTDSRLVYGGLARACSIPVLAAIKRSHLVVPINFDKHMSHYQMLLKHCKLEDIPMDICAARRQETIERQKKYKTPSLKMSNERFFGNSEGYVPYVYVHDDIHKVMAHFDKPVYEMMKKDYSKAFCEKDMFFELPYDHRVKCVQEEAYVIALERKLIPKIETDAFKAFKWAVYRICTTLTSGWFRDFAIDNYPSVMEYDPNYLNKFELAVANKEIVPKS